MGNFSIWQPLKIIAMTILAAVIYGIIHDQITARICVEYFTIGHPPIFDTADPTLLGLGWGIIATWWIGLILGILLAAAAQLGSFPRISVADLYRPLAIILACVGTAAALAGVIGHFAAVRGWVYLVGPLAWRVPENRAVVFLTDLWIHLASYIAGGIGGLICCGWVIRRRRGAALQDAGKLHR